MKDANNFFRSFKSGLVGDLNTIAIGRIKNFNPLKMQADVNILPGETLVVDVPVGTIQTSQYYIRVPYVKGDYVLVAFAQRDIDDIMRGGNASDTQRMLSLDDAVVVCGINLFTDPLPAEDADKLIIGQKNGTAKITMSGGEINLDGVVKVNGSEI
jgi:hypothetical protein